MHYTAQIFAYEVVVWFLNLVTLTVLGLRLYSRAYLTRSVGSDDFTATLSWCVGLTNDAFNIEAIHNGWGHHATEISVGEYSSEQKWEYAGIITFYVCLFLLRTSITLFVLRLLPSYKKWHARFIVSFFFLNLAITVGAVISVAVSCVPFKANWDAVAGKCYSKNGVVVTNQVNAVLACVCDLATAIIPQVLLWDVRMRRKTKRILNFIFALGLITACLSISRAAVNTKSDLLEDVTFKQIAFYWVDMLEAKLGLIFACGPALRQFFSASVKNGKLVPPSRARRPNADFEKMRIRINLRDIFWYRKPRVTTHGVVDARPIFQSGHPPPGANAANPETAPKVKESVLDNWEAQAKNAVGAGAGNKQSTNRMPAFFSSTGDDSSIEMGSGGIGRAVTREDSHTHLRQNGSVEDRPTSSSSPRQASTTERPH